jgi:hypothetical protein
MIIKLNYFKLFGLFLMLPLLIQSQNEKDKWAFTLDLSSVKYAEVDGEIIKGDFITQSPRLSLARHMFKSISFVGSFSTAFGSEQKYTTLDGSVRYDFRTYRRNFNPHVFIGVSVIKAFALTQTTNFGIGNTFWFSYRFGLNLQTMYKFSSGKYPSQKSHTMNSLGIVYSFGGPSTARLWGN